MPAASSIYWNSVDSQRSSVGSSGDTGSARQYIDPWDLENYAYLRRHSVASPLPIVNQRRAPPPPPPPPPPSTSQRASYSRVSHHRHSVSEQDYWYPQRGPIREPGYHAPASVDELYFGSSRQSIHAPNYQSIYEDEIPQWSAPVYTPLSDLDHGKQYEDQRVKEVLRRRKISQARLHEREDCIYHSTSGNIRRNTVGKMHTRLARGDEDCYAEVPHTNIGLSNYGHLKIDYTNSWNSLHRKISK